MKKNLLKKKKLIFCIIIIVMTSIALQYVQISNRNMYLGKDWVFHYNRFYDAAEQIKNKNFQYFISMYGFSQSGRIVNALYGPLFAYLNGMLLIISKSWINFQLFSNFLITFLSSISMFLLLTKRKVKITLSLLFSVMYSSFYLIQSWSFNQALGSWGGVIIPLGVLAATDFFEDNYDLRKLLFLVFTMTISIQIHLLTTLFLLIILSVFFVTAIMTVKQKKRLFGSVVTGAIITLFMTANVWYPLLEVHMENQVLRPFVEWNMEGSAVRFLVDNPLASLPVPVFLLFIFQFLLTVGLKQKLLNGISTILAFIFFVLSLKIFPWNILAQKWPSITIIQFPSRLLLPATVLVILALGLSLNQFLSNYNYRKNYKIFSYFLVLFLVFLGMKTHYTASMDRLSFWYKDEIQSTTNKIIFKSKQPKELRNSFKKGKDLELPLNLLIKPTPDYVPVKDESLAFDKNFNSYDRYTQSIFDNSLNKKLKKKVEDGNLILMWNANGDNVQLPIFVYNRTRLILNDKQISSENIKLNEIGVPTIKSNNGKNVLKVEYRNSFLFYYSIFVTITSWLIFIVSCFWAIRKK